MGNKVSLEDEMVNLRIVSKQMQRSSKKCEKNEKAALEKLKKVSHIVSSFSVSVGCIILISFVSCNRLFSREITKELESMVKMQSERKIRP